MALSGHHVCPNSGKFRCRDGTCISILLRCDGYRDCARDGSDEMDCREYINSNTFEIELDTRNKK